MTTGVIRIYCVILLLVSLAGCDRTAPPPARPSPDTESTQTEAASPHEFPMKKSDEQWKAQLTPEQFRILREKDTEAPFTGKYDHFFEDGLYRCAGCEQPLFRSQTKFDSGCGWPAFYNAIEGAVLTSKDDSFGMQRDELLCSRCGGHLGHVFNDGPPPTGLRYCINSASLIFEPAGQAAPPPEREE